MINQQEFVVFRLDGQYYGAVIDVVREVTYWSQVTRLPNTPSYVPGVIDLREEVLPVVDLRLRLGLPGRTPDQETRMIILSLGDRSAALIVDGVDQVRRLRTDEIVSPDGSMVLRGEEYVAGVVRTEGELVILLDVHRLMGAPATEKGMLTASVT